MACPNHVAWFAGWPSVNLARSLGLRPTSLASKTPYEVFVPEVFVSESPQERNHTPIRYIDCIFSLFGHSWGGVLAPQYAKQVLLYQNRGKSLISMDVARNAMDFDEFAGFQWILTEFEGSQRARGGKGTLAVWIQGWKGRAFGVLIQR